MLRFRHWAVLACVPLLAGLASAEDVIKLKTREVLRGEARAYDQDRRVLTFVVNDGTVRELHRDELDGRSAYRLANHHVEKDDGEGQLRLANYARDVGLYAHAVRHYTYAEKADPALTERIEAERVVLRREAADYIMQNAQGALARGDRQVAINWLTKLVSKLPNEPQAQEAARMLEQLYPEHRNAKDDSLESSYEEVLKKELKNGKKYYDRMLEATQRGLTTTRNMSGAQREFERAWSDGERALKELDKVEKKMVKEAPETTELFDGYRKLVEEHMVESQLHLASIYTTKTNYQKALREVNKAIALDPQNRQALAARARIENAASRGFWD